jgi:hypothetical protein
LSFKEECIKVCEQISDYSNQVGRVPVILLSGGLDSEVVVRSFLESGRDFKMITNKFKNDLNAHEINYIKQFSQRYNLEIEFKELDVVHWLLHSDETNILSHESKCIRPEMLPTMKLMSYVYDNGGIPILANGDLYASKDISPKWRMTGRGEKYQWNYIEYEYILAWMRYCVCHDIVGSINFFQQTPEIVLSMAVEPLIQDLIKNNPIGKQSTRSTKYLVYQKYWADIESRPKFHGGEKISNICDYLRKTRLNRLYGCYNKKYKIPFNEFVKQLSPI